MTIPFYQLLDPNVVKIHIDKNSGVKNAGNSIVNANPVKGNPGSWG